MIGESKPLIVAVDDEQSNLDLLIRALNRDYRLVTFLDPTQALERIPTMTPALILTDHRMPGLLGVEMLARLRQAGVTCPALLMTAYASEKDVARALSEMLVCGVVPKPWRLPELYRFVKGALSPVAGAAPA